MIQRIIDWYNGYTLEEKLELEWLLETAYIKAIEELKTDLLNGDYTIESKAIVINIENMDYTYDRTKAQINMMKLKGSNVRVRLNIDTKSGDRYQFCKEYCVKDLKELKLFNELNGK